ncbi:MAG: MFS transporter [Parvibaculales bacterium]
MSNKGNLSILGLLALINVLNFIDRQLLASFANYIIPDLQLTNQQFGLLTGLVFLFFYCVGGLFMGALADRVHRPRLLAGAVALWSILTAASGAAKSFTAMMIPRLFIGIGESAATPTSISILADRFPQKNMGLVTGIYYLGVPIGVAASLLIVGYLGPVIGWRNCFYLLGGIGVILSLLVLLIPETRKAASMDIRNTENGGQAMNFKQSFALLTKTIRGSTALKTIFLAAIGFHLILGAAAFDQVWLVQERGFDRDEIAVTAGWLAALGGILGNVLGGYGSDKMYEKYGMNRARFLFWVFFLMGPVALGYRLAEPGSAMLYFGIFAGFFHLGLFYGPSYATVQELAPEPIRAMMIGSFILTMNLLGVAVGATGAGIMADTLMAQGHAAPYSVTLLTFTLLSAFAIPMFYMCSRTYEADKHEIGKSEHV